MIHKSLSEKLRTCADLLLEAATEIEDLREKVLYYKRIAEQWEGSEKNPPPAPPTTEIVRCPHGIPEGEFCSFCCMSTRRYSHPNKSPNTET